MPSRLDFYSILACLLVVLAVPVAMAEDSTAPGEEPEIVGDPDLPWLDNEYYKVHLQVRPRVEVAKIDGLNRSEAYTIRSHLGLELKPWQGFSTYAELENVWSLDDGSYNDGAQSPNGDTPIADPETTELNKLYAQFERDDLLRMIMGEGPDVRLRARGGRQELIFDDARFIGNVDWRQNEQTIDSILGETDLGIDGLTAQYAYLWDIRRVFGDNGGPSTQDYNSDSHVARIHFSSDPASGSDAFAISVFAYFLDFERDSPGNSSDTYGTRITGTHDFDEEWSLDYAFSYAFQTDAARNPVDYEAHYVWASGDLRQDDLGSVGVVYEMLGSDDGDARFVTPLATAHKFNGFADAFLDNGGTQGASESAISCLTESPLEAERHAHVPRILARRRRRPSRP